MMTRKSGRTRIPNETAAAPAVSSTTGPHARTTPAGPPGTALKQLMLVPAGIVCLLLAGCDGSHGMMMGGGYAPATFSGNGERIYFTGTSGSGAPVAYTGGNMHLQMMGGGCATCHGADREGGRMLPEFWLEAPALTREALFEHHRDEDGHGDHESYDPGSLRRAISRGLDPGGQPLDPVMPHWSMSESDWKDLLAYLER